MSPNYFNRLQKFFIDEYKIMEHVMKKCQEAKLGRSDHGERVDSLILDRCFVSYFDFSPRMLHALKSSNYDIIKTLMCISIDIKPVVKPPTKKDFQNHRLKPFTKPSTKTIYNTTDHLQNHRPPVSAPQRPNAPVEMSDSIFEIDAWSNSF